MDHREWIDAVTDGASMREAAARSGVPPRTLAHQRDKRHLSAENVIAVAAGYGVHPVRALVDCDYLSAEHATTVDPVTALRLVSDDDLVDEVLRRMKLPGGASLDGPVDELEQRRLARDADTWHEGIPGAARRSDPRENPPPEEWPVDEPHDDE